MFTQLNAQDTIAQIYSIYTSSRQLFSNPLVSTNHEQFQLEIYLESNLFYESPWKMLYLKSIGKIQIRI